MCDAPDKAADRGRAEGRQTDRNRVLQSRRLRFVRDCNAKCHMHAGGPVHSVSGGRSSNRATNRLTVTRRRALASPIVDSEI